jgi:beta-glucosidase
MLGVLGPTPDDLIDRAVRAAAAADAAVVIVGTSEEWETEGRDRESMDLPGAQAELIERVAAVNPRTVVVLNAGSPIATPWVDRVPAILDTWLGGQEMADAIAALLLGDATPSGKLPTTFPVGLEDTPAFRHYPGEAGEVVYGEGVLVGYRSYDTRAIAPRFAFGHGLSYTTFAYDEPRLSAAELSPGQRLTVDVDVTNTGGRPGSEVVQLYVRPLAARLARPFQELKAFAKIALAPGERATARLELDDRLRMGRRPRRLRAPHRQLVARHPANRAGRAPRHGLTRPPSLAAAASRATTRPGGHDGADPQLEGR